jgi:hypothetical protein
LSRPNRARRSGYSADEFVAFRLLERLGDRGELTQRRLEVLDDLRIRDVVISSAGFEPAGLDTRSADQ